MPYKTDRRLYVTADGSRLVDENDPEAAYLLAPAGEEIPDDVAEKYGLVSRETLNDEGDDEPGDAGAEAKERKKKPSTKVRAPGGTKG